MACIDPTQLSKLRNLLEELSDTQAANAIYFAWGNTHQQIADMRNVTPVSVRKSLEEARKKMGLNNLESLRSVINTRINANIWLACCQFSRQQNK